ncbi:OsmC family protein [Methanosphaerula palustris]|nr:OsmC family protein [Methanosphaerula palustris]
MKPTSVVMNITYEGDLKFLAENSAGQIIPIEPGLVLGGSGTTPTPIDYLLASLGSCAGIKVLLDLQGNRVWPDSLRVTITGTRKETPPTVFERLHLTFIITGTLNDRIVADAIQETMTLMCPVAVMIGRAAEVTWEYRIS